MEKNLRDNNILSPTLGSRLKKAVELRNCLAHRYFMEQDRAFTTREGREQMISELHEKAKFLKDLDDEFSKIMHKFMISLGITNEEIQSTLAEYLRGAPR